MDVQLKPLDQQVIVITGASSGIGLATAQMAAGKGAKLILSARSEDTLNSIAQEIRDAGGEATVCAADVGDPTQVERIAQTAIDVYGRIDTWVNDPVSRSTANCGKRTTRKIAACSTPISGAWSTARSPRCRTCAHKAAH